METKLELKHLAPYLPYGLKAKLNNGDIHEITLAGEGVILCTDVRGSSGNMWPIYFDDFKPLLNPLSETIIYRELLSPYFKECFDMDGGIIDNILSCPYTDLEMLFKYHYDVFYLINNGLALAKATH